MAEFRERFLREHPELKLVKDSEHKQLLHWAQRNRFIEMIKFQNRFYFSEQDLEKAKMWKEKLGGE